MLSLTLDVRVDVDFVTAGEEALRLYDQMNQAINIDRTDKERHASQLCLAFYAAKIQRVTRAALTLVLAGQGVEAMSLIREQNDFVIALEYYHKHPTQALLFMVSEALQKRDRARQVMAFDKKAREDPQRQRQLAQLEVMAEKAYREFPQLRRPKGKSANSANPIMIDWSEPDPKAMLADLMEGWLRQHYTDTSQSYTEDDFLECHKRVVERIYFMRNTFVSQAKHGTAFSLSDGIEVDDRGKIGSIRSQVEKPNELAYHFLLNALPPLKIICEFNDLQPFEDRLNELGLVSRRLREKLGIKEEPIPPLASS